MLGSVGFLPMPAVNLLRFCVCVCGVGVGEVGYCIQAYGTCHVERDVCAVLCQDDHRRFTVRIYPKLLSQT